MKIEWGLIFRVVVLTLIPILYACECPTSDSDNTVAIPEESADLRCINACTTPGLSLSLRAWDRDIATGIDYYEKDIISSYQIAAGQLNSIEILNADQKRLLRLPTDLQENHEYTLIAFNHEAYDALLIEEEEEEPGKAMICLVNLVDEPETVFFQSENLPLTRLDLGRNSPYIKLAPGTERIRISDTKGGELGALDAELKAGHRYYLIYSGKAGHDVEEMKPGLHLVQLK